jgi:hypothetical protein
MTAMAGASGVRCWLQGHHLGWLTPRRLHAMTVVLFVSAIVASSVTLSGSSGPGGRQAAANAHHSTR